MQTMEHELLDLKLEHACLEQELQEERARPMPNAMRCSMISKRKLLVKDRMTELQERAVARKWPESVCSGNWAMPGT